MPNFSTTVNSRVDAQFDKLNGAPIQLDSVNGAVLLTLPSDDSQGDIIASARLRTWTNSAKDTDDEVNDRSTNVFNDNDKDNDNDNENDNDNDNDNDSASADID